MTLGKAQQVHETHSWRLLELAVQKRPEAFAAGGPRLLLHMLQTSKDTAQAIGRSCRGKVQVVVRLCSHGQALALAAWLRKQAMLVDRLDVEFVQPQLLFVDWASGMSALSGALDVALAAAAAEAGGPALPLRSVSVRGWAATTQLLEAVVQLSQLTYLCVALDGNRPQRLYHSVDVLKQLLAPRSSLSVQITAGPFAALGWTALQWWDYLTLVRVLPEQASISAMQQLLLLPQLAELNIGPVTPYQLQRLMPAAAGQQQQPVTLHAWVFFTSPQGVERLVKWVQTHGGSLRTLKVEGMDSGDSIAEALSMASQLQTLELDHCTQASSQLLNSLAAAHCTRLLLSLDGMHACALQRFTALEYLSLNVWVSSEQQHAQLAATLQQLPRLRDLALGFMTPAAPPEDAALLPLRCWDLSPLSGLTRLQLKSSYPGTREQLPSSLRWLEWPSRRAAQLDVEPLVGLSSLQHLSLQLVAASPNADDDLALAVAQLLRGLGAQLQGLTVLLKTSGGAYPDAALLAELRPLPLQRFSLEHLGALPAGFGRLTQLPSCITDLTLFTYDVAASQLRQVAQVVACLHSLKVLELELSIDDDNADEDDIIASAAQRVVLAVVDRPVQVERVMVDLAFGLALVLDLEPWLLQHKEQWRAKLQLQEPYKTLAWQDVELMMDQGALLMRRQPVPELSLPA